MACNTRSKRLLEESIRADLPDSPALRPRKRRRAGSAPPSPTLPVQQPDSTPRLRGSKLSSRQKADKVIEYMRDQYKWTVKDLVRSLVCDAAESGNGTSKEERAKRLIDAIWGQSEVLKELERNALLPGVRTYERELKALESTSFFGTWKHDDEFKRLDLPSCFTEIRRLAPRLLELLELLTAPLRERDDTPNRQSEPLEGRYILILSIVSFTRRRNTCNNLPRMIGLYLQSMGVKRRVLQVLAGLGVCEGYHAINRLNDGIAIKATNRLTEAGARSDTVIVYDNFDYEERVQHQRVGDHGGMRSVTSGLLLHGTLPPEGLRQEMLREEIPLKLKDIINAPGNEYDDIQKEISVYFIAQALRNQHPTAIKRLFAATSQPTMPCLNVLEARPTHRFSLGPILSNEGTIQGTYEVLETIFKDQLHCKTEDFGNRLWLVYGDQKTVSNIRSVINQRREASHGFERHRWVLPLSAFFHLRQTYLWMMQATHFGGENQNSPSTLYHNMNFWNRHHIPAVKGPFHHVEELVMHSFEARIVAMFYTVLQNADISIDSAETIEEYLKTVTTQRYLELIEEVYRIAFSKEVQQPAIKKNDEYEDEEFSNHIRYLQHAETYAVLKYAIKHGDVGLIERAIDRCCIYFHGSKQHKYAHEMLLYKRLLATNAATPELKRAILANGLVNTRGKKDSFVAIDLINEQLNLTLKQILWARRTSTFGIDKLFGRTALTASYCGSLKECLEAEFGEYTNAEHTSKTLSTDVRNLAYEMAKGSIKRQSNGRTVTFKAPHLVVLGSQRLIAKSLAEFNQRVVYVANQLAPTLGGEIEEDEAGELPEGSFPLDLQPEEE